jgi:heat-inducible transcriptional repressor
MKSPVTVLDEIDARSREIFRRIVETYLATGEPVGSRSVSRLLPMQLSPASVRNVMTELEERGLIYAPHTSAGRLPTQPGLRMFVDALLEVNDIPLAEQQQIQQQIAGNRNRSVADLMREASGLLSGLSQCAGLVLTEKRESRLKQIEFVPLEPGKALVVLVGSEGNVENRIIDVPPGLSPSSLSEAANFLNARIRGLTMSEVRAELERALAAAGAELDTLTTRVIEAGLAVWSGEDGHKSLIVRGRSRLIQNFAAEEDLQRIQTLFDEMESQQDLIEILRSAEAGEGVRIFIGAENKRFSLSGSSIIVAPFQDERSKLVGVLGVIGPTRLNYARIIPVVDYTARLMGRLIS